MELWLLVGIVLAAVVFGVGVILTQGWLIGVGLVVIPLIAVWGLAWGWNSDPRKP